MPIPKGGKIPFRHYTFAEILCLYDGLPLPTVRDQIEQVDFKQQIADWPPKLCGDKHSQPPETPADYWL